MARFWVHSSMTKSKDEFDIKHGKNIISITEFGKNFSW